MLDPTPNLAPKQDGDIFLMECAAELFDEPLTLRLINNIQQALQVHSLADICTLQGNRIQQTAWEVQVPITNKASPVWPRTGQIPAAAINHWKVLLFLFTRSWYDVRLLRPLGQWHSKPQHQWWYSTASGCLYKQECHIWKELKQKPGGPSKNKIGQFQKDGNWVQTLPSDLTMAEVHI